MRVTLIVCLLAVLTGCTDTTVQESSSEASQESVAGSGTESQDSAVRNLSDVELHETERGRELKAIGDEAAKNLSDVADTMQKGAEKVAEDLKEGAQTIHEGAKKALEDLKQNTTQPQGSGSGQN